MQNESQVHMTPHQRRTLAVCCIGFFMVLLDLMIVNTALPTIQTRLHAGFTGVQWVVDAYTLSFAALLLTGGTSPTASAASSCSASAWRCSPPARCCAACRAPRWSSTSAGRCRDRGRRAGPVEPGPRGDGVPRPAGADAGRQHLRCPVEHRAGVWSHHRRRLCHRTGLAVGVLRQRSDRRRLLGVRHPRAQRVDQSARPPHRPRRPGIQHRRLGRADLRADRARHARVVRRSRGGTAPCRRCPADGFPRRRVAGRGADAPPAPVPAAGRSAPPPRSRSRSGSRSSPSPSSSSSTSRACRA